MSYLTAGLPAPTAQADGLDASYWEGLRRHELLVQRCAHCATWQFPPEWLCHACQSRQLEWRPVSGQGRVFSWQRVWHPAHPALKSAVPYLVVLVELPDAGNERMLGNLLGDPQQVVRSGMAVDVVFEDHETFTLPQWRLSTPR